MNKSFILIAEDDADDRLLLQTAFSEIGYSGKLAFVTNGEELSDFLNVAENDAAIPGVIILDLNMPRKSGREILKEIRNNKRFQQVHIAIFSTTKNEAEVQECFALGADNYFVKPINYNELLRFVREIYAIWHPVSQK
jgi:two-component system response regulator